MGDGGKGSRARPFSVDQKTFDSNWEAIFGQKSEPRPEPIELTKKEEEKNES